MSTRTSSKKILQNFQARDRLWEIYSARAVAMDCSVDYLINEAMRVYAETQGFLTLEEENMGKTSDVGQNPMDAVVSVDPGVEEIVEDMDDIIEEVDDIVEDIDDIVEEVEEISELNGSELMNTTSTASSDEASLVEALLDDDEADLPVLDDAEDAEPSVTSGDSTTALDDELPDLDLPDDDEVPAPPSPRASAAPTLVNEPSVPKPPAARAPGVPSPPRPPKAVRTPSVSSVTGASGITAPQRPGSTGTGSKGTAEPELPQLTMIYEGRKIRIHKTQFILGRGTKDTDMTIKDPNVSRKHAAVIYHNGAFYIKDLGSTNGVEFGKQLVDSKRIDEGDRFSICDHQFHFTYS